MRGLRAGLAALALALLALTTGCAPSTAIETADAVVLDVRTPEEYAAGHLEGALNLDVSAADFDASLADLDPAASYIVYCRTGSRSAAAVARMAEAGFASVTDAGGISSAAAASGLSIVVD